MKQIITINNAKIIDGKIEIEITQEMARKVLEESGEIQVGDCYWYREGFLGIKNREIPTRDIACEYENDALDSYRKEQDNCLPCKDYTEQQQKEYFDKRDARRAAEYRIKKAIEKMDVGKKKTCEVGYHFESGELCIAPLSGFVYTPKHLHCSESTARYMLEHHTEDYKIYFEIE